MINENKTYYVQVLKNGKWVDVFNTNSKKLAQKYLDDMKKNVPDEECRVIND